MRHLASALIGAILLLGLWWQLSPADQPDFDHFIPADVVAVLIINDFPDSLDFVSQTRLREWVEIDLTIRPEVRAVYESRFVHEITQSVETVCLSIHGVRASPNDSYRIDFTAILVPQSGRGPLLEKMVEKAVIERFGRENTDVLEEGQVRIFRGKEDGQIFYLEQADGLLKLSNTAEGWAQCTLARNGGIPNLAESQGYREILSRLDSGSDLFLYFRGSRQFEFLPEFGYTVDISSEGVRDAYHEVIQ